jgi:hypothetical protein
MRKSFIRTRRQDPAAARGRFGEALKLLSLVGIVAAGWNACRQVHRERRAERTGLPVERLQTWEDEGGRLPATDAPATASVRTASVGG